MILADLHNHTAFSPDSQTPLDEMVATAEHIGFGYFGITEHVDLDYAAFGMEMIETDLEAYAKACLAKKAETRPLQVLFGAEFGFHPDAAQKYAALNAQYPFDYVINSVHAVNGLDPYFAEYFEGKTQEKAYGDYFERVLESVDAGFQYEILGHIGYCIRCAPYPDRLTLSPRHLAILDEIFRRAIRLEKVVEINTNVRQCGSLTLPTAPMLRRYFDLGGRLISFGSDAHQPRRVGENRVYVEHLAKSLGFTEWCRFCERKRVLFPIE